MPETTASSARTFSSVQAKGVHGVGVACALAAGVWLGAAEAPTKLVSSGLSPFAISLCMVAGVFTARWTVPTLLRGTTGVFSDLGRYRHLLPSAVLAGMIWAVANTLTVFAIRDVGLTIAFPLWNANSLVGIFWGWLLFGELRGASGRNIAKVLLGSTAILLAAILLGYATVQQSGAHPGRALAGILAAAGASLLWGTMYIPYRKAYISGMNPLSFVTVFTIGELVTMFALVLALDGGTHAQLFHSAEVRPMLFWLFLGGFVWVIGDIFQQYACKYLGIGRGIPLSNTNQLWGMAWGALVFGELAHADMPHRLLVVAGSIVMILGALAVSTAVAGARENASTDHALEAECRRYGLDNQEILAHWSAPQNSSGGTGSPASAPRRWWDYLILTVALGVFLWLGAQARPPALAMNLPWLAVLSIVGILTALASGYALWRTTRFS